MDLTWLAAVIQPKDVAPHGNFRPETISPPSWLAAVVLGEDWRWRGVEQNLEPAPLRDVDPDVELARQSLQAETLPVAAEELSARITRGKIEDSAKKCALALVASCAWSELDEGDRCLGLLAEVLREIDQRTAEHRLVRAILLQQQSLRLRDFGGDNRQSGIESLALLASIRVEELGSFALSEGVSWTSSTTLKEMLELLREAAYSLLPTRDRSGDADDLPSALIPTWQERVKAPASRTLLRLDRRRVGVYRDLLNVLYGQKLKSATRTIIDGQPNPDLFITTFAQELLGHIRVYDARAELAQLRFVLSGTSADSYQLSDALRLLRHAGVKRELDMALRSVRAGGPLSALGDDARRILRTRLQVNRLRTVELRVLRTAAELLTRSEAQMALSAVLSSIESDGPPNLPGQWELKVLRQEVAWLAAAALANSAGMQQSVAQRLLAAAAGTSDDDSEMQDRAIARAFRELELEDIAESTIEKWNNEVGAMENARPATAEVLVTAGREVGRLAGIPTSLDDVAVRLNIALRGGPFDADVLEASASIAKEALASIRRDAANGSYAMRSIVAADVAAGLVVYAGAAGLWPDLADFLTDPRGQRSDKSPALERIARDASVVPADMALRIRASAEQLLSAQLDLIDGSLIPYPEALRFLGALGLLPEERLFSLTAQLAGMRDDAGRREAARTLTLLTPDLRSSWVVALSLQLSHDDDVEVRAAAGMALAHIAAWADENSGVAVDRMLQLMRQDGLLIPLLVLRGIEQISGLPVEVYSEAHHMSTDHPSRIVRLEASRLIASSG